MVRDRNPRGAGDQLRAQLIAAAAQALTESRPSAPISLRAVARAAGVSPAAIYLQFSSAEELVAAVVDNQVEDLRLALDLYGPEMSRDRMLEIGRRYLGWGLANPGAYQVVFESADRLGIEYGRETPGFAIVRRMAELIGSEDAALRLWVCMHGLVSLRIHKPELGWPDADAEIAAILDALLPELSAAERA
jgi:AcrR family transcriptional regulator